MKEYTIIKRSIIDSSKEKEFKHIHTVNGEIMEIPYELQIVAYPDDNGFYLLYIDEDGRELTDTFHETIEKAEEQALWEFSVKYNDWMSF